MNLRVLIVNAVFAGRTGTEMATRDLACGLLARGHHVTVYAPILGTSAEESARAGVAVVSRLADVGRAPDVVHGHAFLETVEALAHFPGSRGVFVCRDRTGVRSIPPLTARVHRYVALDEDCLERLRDDWSVPPPQIATILNAVDTRRFLPRSPLPVRPSRALVFSNDAIPGTLDVAVRSACEPLGISVDMMGEGAGASCKAPEAQLGKYDLVFAKSRCAIESMAVGAAVILCDAGGSGPMVTSSVLPRLRPWNFGQRMLHDPLSAATLAREIRRYDPADAAAVSQAIREVSTLDSALDQYEAVYGQALAEPIHVDADTRTLTEPLLARMSRLERELAAYRSPDRMRPLSDDDLVRIHLAAEQFPAGMIAGASAFLRVRVQNGLEAPIGTWPPFPLHFAYRWRRVESPEFAPMETLRTLLHRSVGPGADDPHMVRVVAPSTPGRYVLRITLVQEGWRWLDEGAAPVCVDVDMLVTKPTLLTSIGR